MGDMRGTLGRWLAALATGEVAEGDSRAGIDAAVAIVGPARFEELVAWVAARPREVVVREQSAAMDLFIRMAHADRAIDRRERTLIERIMEDSGFSLEELDPLFAALRRPKALDDLEARLTHPVLREIMLGLAWRMAGADGQVVDPEHALFDEFARRLAIPPERAEAIRRVAST